MAVSFDQDGFQIHWQLFEGTSSKVYGISVDWTTDVVYWTDAAYNAIYAVSMAMPDIAEIIIEDLDEPYGIATHPMKGFLFWTDVGDHPKIMRSSLGGRQVTVVREFVDQTVATALAVDFTENRLYWLFENKKQRQQGFGSSDLFGNNQKITELKERGVYFDLDVFQGHVFLTNQDYHEIHVVPFNSDRPVERQKLQNGKPFGMVVLDAERQTRRSNACLEPKCPGVCTRSNSSVDCFCNAELKETAEPEIVRLYCGHGAFSGILIPKSDGIYSIVKNFAEFGRYTNIRPQRLMESHNTIKALTSDSRMMRVFFYESNTKIIKSSRLMQDARSEIISYAIGDVGGLAIDGSSENLYWTDIKYGHIMVSKADGSAAYKLIDNLGEPKAIAVYPRRMFLFWSNLKDFTLNRCFLDGTGCVILVSGQRYKISDIAIDYKTDKLYWTQMSYRSAVYVSDLDGTRIEEVFARPGSRFTGVAVMHDYILVSDSSHQSLGLYAVDKTSKRLVGKATYGWFEYWNWFGVDFHHSSSEPRSRTSPCDIRRNPCDQICIPSNTTQRYKCFCGIGYRVNDTDNTKCEIDSEDSPYLPLVLLADQRYQKLIYISFGSRLVIIPVQQISQPYSVTFDMNKKQVYWSDLDTGTISRADLDGGNQEVIIADPDAYFSSLAIDSGNRLLYYFVLKMHEFVTGRELCGSLVAYDIEKLKSVVLIDGVLNNPDSLALNVEYGFVFFIDQGCVCRVDMNGSNLQSITSYEMQVTLVASQGEYVYFTNEIDYGDSFKPKTMQIWRCGLDGQNKSLVLELQDGEMTGLKVCPYHDRGLLYWINTSTRAVQRFSLSRPSRGIENVGPINELFLPTDIFVNFVKTDDESVCEKMPGECEGLCLPSPNGPSCIDSNRIIVSHIEESNKTKAEFCRIPDISHGEVIGYRTSLLVPHGFIISVKCFPLHKISSHFPMRCYRGEWSHIPKCTLEYDICGDEFRGYKAYTESGQYFVYPKATKVNVICIGGGGGGYDATNDAEKAGDGGDSRFSTYFTAFGGKGGSLLKGGVGGYGHYRGGNGSTNINCTTGGTAGEDEISTRLDVPGISHNLFCGAGGYSDDCNSDVVAGKRQFAGPGGSDGNRSAAGLYGGGAGSRTGGTGGGGGYSRMSYNLSPKEVVNIEVGKAGYPSYGQPGHGLVVVTWGDFRIDDFVEDFDVINECYFSRSASTNKRKNETSIISGTYSGEKP